jgi:hypothetical protein
LLSCLSLAPDEVPDICGFLDGKKKVCDNDPETNPFDDVRHYAYEGDGNTTGSLSSLASGELCYDMFQFSAWTSTYLNGLSH